MAYLNGSYIPETFQDILARLTARINEEFGTSYTEQTIIGTNFYKYFYALIQEVIALEIDFSQAYEKLSDYIRDTNAKLNVHKTPSDALLAAFKTKGYNASLMPTSLANAGVLGVCVEVDNTAEDYEERKAEILEILKENTAAGMFFAGEERGERTLSNGQNMEFAFALPLVQQVELRLTLTLSRDSNILVDDESEIKKNLLANLAAFYGLGRKFEPERYFTISRDAAYSAAISLEWKFVGAEQWRSDIYDAQYSELLRFSKDKITVVLQ